MGHMLYIRTVHPYLCLAVVVFVRILTHVFTKDVPRVFVRSSDVRGLPSLIPAKEDCINYIYI